MKKYIAIVVSVICLLSLETSAQKERKFIRNGNDLFEENNYENSEVEYRKALDKKINSYEAGFNLGDALYKQKKYDEALKQFQSLTVAEQNPKRLGEIYHNIGNTLLMNRKIDESIEAYKQSLRHFPNSKETKYNLEYARRMKQKQEEEKKKQEQNKDQQNKDQDKKDQKEQDKKEQDQKEQEKKDQEKKDQQDQQNKPENQDKNKNESQEQKSKISEQDAKRLLEALENDEKQVQEKVQKAKAKAQKAKRKKIKKNW